MWIFRLLFAATWILIPSFGDAQMQSLDAPNVVVISERLITSGQPSPKALASLGAAGFQAVIYLAPATVPNAVKNEPDLLKSQDIEFVHIPIPFGEPNAAHFEAVSQALTRLSNKKVLIHCEINLRASSMVFLHRATVLREDPAKAYAAVASVWSPSGAWRTLIEDRLRVAGVKTDMF
jgi:protein tyrosine phosphatase (PTP) superfamily phosphohydrolase (DUF442 family)